MFWNLRIFILLQRVYFAYQRYGRTSMINILHFNFQVLTLFAIVFAKCAALSVHCSIEGDKILGKKQIRQSRGCRIFIEGRKSNLAFLCGKDARLRNGPEGD